jgi:hypothetical protein
MVDWGLVAVIIALLAYPLQVFAIPPLLSLVNRLSRSLQRLLWPSARLCDSFEWAHFPNGSLHLPSSAHRICSEPGCESGEAFEAHLISGQWSRSLSLLFPPAWASERRMKVEKPASLPSGKKYIRADAEVLLVYAYLLEIFRSYPDRSLDTPEKRFGQTIQLSELNGILFAKPEVRLRNMSFNSSQNRFNRNHNVLGEKSRADMEVELFRGRNSFDTTLKILNGSEIPFPLSNPDDFRRGGWVVALAMCHTEKFYPNSRVPKLLSRIVREQLVDSRFKVHGETRIKLSLHVDWALGRVIATLEHILQPAFPSDRKVTEAAVRLAHGLREHWKRFEPNGSWHPLDRTSLFSGAIGGPEQRVYVDQMTGVAADDCALAVRIFNTNEQLTEDQKSRIQPILLSVCRCAIKGIWQVIEFYRNGSYIIEPELLQKHRYVYLEDRTPAEE